MKSNVLLQNYIGESKLTILSITHDIDEVAKSDYVIAMDGGHVAMTGTTRKSLKIPIS